MTQGYQFRAKLETDNSQAKKSLDFVDISYGYTDRIVRTQD